jgi:Acyl-coenzyme A:6-aminopenicillanic acid acyl-transferase
VITTLPYEDLRLPPITVSGSPADIGFGLGRHVAAVLHAHMRQKLRDVYVRWRGNSLVLELQAAAKARFPAAFAELEGLANGADVPVADLFLLNCLADLPLERPAVDSGCTTLMLPGGAQSGEAALILHNEDASLTAMTPWFIAHVEPNQRPSFTSLCYAGRLPGNALSVNAAGLVQTINDIRLLDYKVGVPRAFLARAILECNSCESAIGVIQATARASGYHHAIASGKDGKLFSIEAPSSGISAISVTTPLGHANHLVHEPLIAAAQYVVGGSSLRQAVAEANMAEARGSPLTIMRSAGDRVLMQTPSAANDWHKTIATAIFEVYRGSVCWSLFGVDAQAIFRGYVVPSAAG